MSLYWPTDDNSVASGGEYLNDRGPAHFPRYHQGIDSPVGVGTPIYGSGDGTVLTISDTGNTAGYGRYVTIQYGETTVLTAHMSGVNIAQGDNVSVSTLIGHSGGAYQTDGAGASTGPHVHVQTTSGGYLVNPQTVLDPRSSITATNAPVTVPPTDSQDVDLTIGSYGEDVLAVQQFFNRVFPAYSALDEDSNYGPLTAGVVTEFQTRTGLTADGIFGPITRAKAEEFGFSA